MDHPRYSERTVEWGNWGITFLDVQPDRTKNYGKVIGTRYFPVGTRGPTDYPHSIYNKMVRDWIDARVLPSDVVSA